MKQRFRSGALAAAVVAAAGFAAAAAAQTDAVASAGAEPPSVRRNADVRIPLGGTVHVEGMDVSITFERVLEDSRCPRSVRCVWAGQAALELTVRLGDGAPVAHTLVLTGGTAADVAAGPLRVRQASLSPPRDPTQPLQPYVLRLRLGAAESSTGSAPRSDAPGP